MKLVRRNFGRPASLPTFWNEFFADDFFTKHLHSKKECNPNAWNRSNVPAVNIKSEDEHYFIEVAAPGFVKSDFSVELDNEVLTISAKKEVNEEAKEKGYTHQEFSNKAFKRTFTIPEDSVDVEGIEATYEAGVLVISIPKKEVEEKKLNIDVL